MNSTPNLPHKWASLRSEDIGRLENELARETCATHPLYAARTKALFRRYPGDNVLFEVYDRDLPYYCVHLTWSIETDPFWPYIIRFRSIDDFCANYQLALEVDVDSPNWNDEKWRFYERETGA